MFNVNWSNKRRWNISSIFTNLIYYISLAIVNKLLFFKIALLGVLCRKRAIYFLWILKVTSHLTGLSKWKYFFIKMTVKYVCTCIIAGRDGSRYVKGRSKFRLTLCKAVTSCKQCTLCFQFIFKPYFQCQISCDSIWLCCWDLIFQWWWNSVFTKPLPCSIYVGKN